MQRNVTNVDRQLSLDNEMGCVGNTTLLDSCRTLDSAADGADGGQARAVQAPTASAVELLRSSKIDPARYQTLEFNDPHSILGICRRQGTLIPRWSRAEWVAQNSIHSSKPMQKDLHKFLVISLKLV
jgi:hypothetical protein